MKFGIDDLIGVLGFRPTDEQLQVVTADLERPLLVVAGAGSGKTTVMAARVIWAVGTGFVQPQQVLGVTFTTKAAGELGQRLRQRLKRLAAQDRGDLLEGDPTVLTYHSFGRQLIGEHGLRIGVEPNVRLMSDDESAQFAYDVVVKSKLRLELVGRSPGSVAVKLIELDGQLAEHSVLPEELSGFDHEEVERLTAVPKLTVERLTAAPKLTVELASILKVARARIELGRLVEDYRKAKLAAGRLDFADLMRLSELLVKNHPVVVAGVKTEFKLVLLDEYQDTSCVQTRILSGLFGNGHSVTAVGDPLQGIFGWRGASAVSITDFGSQFTDTDGACAQTLTLSISQRSRPPILAAANTVASPLRVRHPASVVLRAAEDSDPVSFGIPPDSGRVAVALLRTHEQEVRWLAAQVKAQLEEGVSAERIAVLCRVGGDARPVAEALAREGIAAQMSGVESLFAQPQISELLSVVRVVHDPGDNLAVLRCLRGPRYRIGNRDLVLLGRRAGDLAGGSLVDKTNQPISDPEVDSLQDKLAKAVQGADPVDLPSLAEALADPGPQAEYPFSGQARERFGQFCAEIDSFRRIANLPLLDLVVRVINAIGLDVEAELLRLRNPMAGEVLNAALSQFRAFVAGFRGNGTAGASLGGLLTWIARAERLGVGVDLVQPPQADAVRISTVHKAKGLEWDVVFVPFMCDSVFPSSRSTATWLTDSAQIPHWLRGDRTALPSRPVDAPKGIARFKSDMRDHGLLEERQLVYVALTRARNRMWLSGHWWGPTQKRQRGPSVFINEVKEQLALGDVVEWEPPPAEGEVNPALVDASPDPPAKPSSAALESTLAELSSSHVPPACTRRLPCHRRTITPSQTGAIGGSGLSEKQDSFDLPAMGWPVDAGYPAGVGQAGDTAFTSEEEELVAEEEELVADEEELVAQWWATATRLLDEVDREDSPNGTSADGGDSPASETISGGLPAFERRGELSTSRLITAVADPSRYLADIRRPVPRQPSTAARTGIEFHEWVQEYFTNASLFEIRLTDDVIGNYEFELDELDNAELAANQVELCELFSQAEEEPRSDESNKGLLSELRAGFIASGYAERRPVAVEHPFTIALGGRVVTGRIDAVFRSGEVWEVVDWKTNAVPNADPTQLAVYRLAWSQAAGVPLEIITGVFVYVRSGKVIKFKDLPGENQMIEKLDASLPVEKA